MIFLLVLLVLASMLEGFMLCSIFIFEMHDLPTVYITVFLAACIVFIGYLLR